MISVELTPEQQKLVEKIASEHSFTDYQLKTRSGSGKGDNYLGIIKSVTIDDGTRKLDLMLKSADVGELRNQMPVRKAYLREIFVYDHVFKMFQEFQEEFGISDPFKGNPKHYATSDTEFSETVVMENLRESGFQMWNRKIPMDTDHLSAGMKEYAKFHAVSLAMKEKRPEEFKKMADVMERHTFEETITNEEKASEFFEMVMQDIWKVFEDDPSTTEVMRKYDQQMRNGYGGFVGKPELSGLSVIVHGDCWCNNLMFRYENREEPSRPTDVRIIDWQLSRTGTPAMDLTFFFLIHSSKETIFDYERYLKLYHETLSKNLREFSCDPDTGCPYSALLADWNKQVKFGIHACFLMLKTMLRDSEDALDLGEITEDGKSFRDLERSAPRDVDTYYKRIRDLVAASIELGFI